MKRKMSNVVANFKMQGAVMKKKNHTYCVTALLNKTKLSTGATGKKFSVNMRKTFLTPRQKKMWGKRDYFRKVWIP